MEFARRGYSVTGVDQIANFLDRGRQLASLEEIAIEFVQQDMRVFRKPK